MSVTKESWLKLRMSKKIDIEHMYEGLKLNHTFKMDFDTFNSIYHFFKNNPFINDTLIIESKMRLDKHFNIHTLHAKNGKEIMVIP